MKFTIELIPFRRIMTNAMKVVNKKASIAILSSVKICMDKDGNYELVAATNENTLHQSFPLSLIEGDFTPFCVEATELNNVVMNAPGDVLTFNIGNLTGNVSIQYYNGVFSLPISTADEFPEMEAIKKKLCSFKMPASDLIPTIKNGSQCCADDPLRPVLNSIYFDVKPDGCVLVATDGHTLMKQQFQYGAPFVEGKPISMIMMKEMVGVVITSFAASEEIEIATDGNRVIEMTGAGCRLTMLTVEGNFPHYDNVIPRENPNTFVINRKLLISAIRRISAFASQSSRLIILTIKDKELCISGCDIDYNRSAEEHVNLVECNVPDGFRIGMKDVHLLSEANIAGSEEIRILMSDPNSAMIIKEVDDKSLLTLLAMPMNLDAKP